MAVIIKVHTIRNTPRASSDVSVLRRLMNVEYNVPKVNGDFKISNLFLGLGREAASLHPVFIATCSKSKSSPPTTLGPWLLKSPPASLCPWFLKISRKVNFSPFNLFR